MAYFTPFFLNPREEFFAPLRLRVDLRVIAVLKI